MINVIEQRIYRIVIWHAIFRDLLPDVWENGFLSSGWTRFKFGFWYQPGRRVPGRMIHRMSLALMLSLLLQYLRLSFHQPDVAGRCYSVLLPACLTVSCFLMLVLSSAAPPTLANQLGGHSPRETRTSLPMFGNTAPTLGPWESPQLVVRAGWKRGWADCLGVGAGSSPDDSAGFLV